MPAPTPPTELPAPGPISPAQLEQLSLAEQRERRFAGALKVAAFNGYGLAVVGSLALLFDLSEPASWLLAAALLALAYQELRGRKLLASYDRSGLTVLMRNQLALIVVVCLYSLSRIYAALHGDNPLAQVLRDNADAAEVMEASELLDDTSSMYRYGIVAFYALVMALTALIQGGCALYYATRRKHLNTFLSETPAWVIDWHRSRAGAR